MNVSFSHSSSFTNAMMFATKAPKNKINIQKDAQYAYLPNHTCSKFWSKINLCAFQPFSNGIYSLLNESIHFLKSSACGVKKANWRIMMNQFFWLVCSPKLNIGEMIISTNATVKYLFSHIKINSIHFNERDSRWK